ncbi:MAG: glycosyltransferase family 2 protein [Planctomycetota bacterium]
MNILIPMAGGGDTFKERGFAHIKSLVEIKGEPLIQHVWANFSTLNAKKHIYVIRKEDAGQHRLADVLKLMDPRAELVLAQGPTHGAACTALLAIGQIDPDEELVITNGDQILKTDLLNIINGFRSQNLDGGVVVFDSIHPRWSFVRLDASGLVVEAAEKRPISRWATAGMYYFKRGGDFIRAAMAMIRKDASVNGMFYICPCFNEMVLNLQRIGVHAIERNAYLSLATPADAEYYENYLSTLQ